ncbi:MAG: ABC transporter permease, partial [Cyclobacteriaceae bacterium]
MLKNYFNVALRNLLKHKFYSLLNVMGLSIGLACFMLISLFIKDELGYDTFNEDYQRTYRVDFAATLNGNDIISAQTGIPVASVLKADYPQVDETIRLRKYGTWFLKRKDAIETFKEENVLLADSNFFKFFSVKLVYGNPETALKKPKSLVLDLDTSRKIFGDIDPVGQVLVLDNSTDYEVGGVYENLPQNSHFHQNVILSMHSLDWGPGNWLSTNFNTYVKLKEGVPQIELESQFPEMTETYCGPLIEQFLNMNLTEFRESGNALGFSLTPITDIHLYSDKEDELEANSDIKYVYIFSAIALFILALACINFMNLSTARSSNRAKEVGVRKVMGAFRNQLIYQFLSEAILISLISFVVAYSLVLAALPGFNLIASKELSYLVIFEPGYLLAMIGIMLVVGLLAGSYPAFYLSMFKPVEVLKGKIRQGVKSGPVRSTLVVFQFSISIIMIIGTAIVFDQLSFIQNKKLGYDKDQILMVNDTFILGDQVQSFKEEASRNANIVSSTVAGFTPTSSYGNTDMYFKNASAAADESLVLNEARVDYNFLSTLGIGIKEGRAFSKDFSSDSSAVLLNESAVAQFGYENPLGSMLYTYGDGEDNSVVALRIVGVVEDFHFQSLRNNISPLVIKLGGGSGTAMFKIQMANTEETI